MLSEQVSRFVSYLSNAVQLLAHMTELLRSVLLSLVTQGAVRVQRALTIRMQMVRQLSSDLRAADALSDHQAHFHCASSL